MSITVKITMGRYVFIKYFSRNKIYCRLSTNCVHFTCGQQPGLWAGGAADAVHPTVLTALSLHIVQYRWLLCIDVGWCALWFSVQSHANRQLVLYPYKTRGGMYGQIYPFGWRSSPEQSLRELLKAKGYIWPYIPSWVLIRTVYHFNGHKANNSLISLIDK